MTQKRTFICYIYDDVVVRASITENGKELAFYRDDHYTGGEWWVDMYKALSKESGTYLESYEEDDCDGGYYFEEYYRYDF